jgi:excisionase family DNA binding protein
VQPPDEEHVWLRTREAAEFMGVSQPAISQWARAGRLPFVEHGCRRWFRRDHLELVRHADLVKRPKPRN